MFLRDRAPGTSEPCVGDAEDIAEDDWGAELGIFPDLVVVLIFFGFFPATVAQASSEGWFARVLGAEACDFVRLEAARGDVFLCCTAPGYLL